MTKEKLGIVLCIVGCSALALALMTTFNDVYYCLLSG
jgi:hypothetical protein